MLRLTLCSLRLCRNTEEDSDCLPVICDSCWWICIDNQNLLTICNTRNTEKIIVTDITDFVGVLENGNQPGIAPFICVIDIGISPFLLPIIFFHHKLSDLTCHLSTKRSKKELDTLNRPRSLQRSNKEFTPLNRPRSLQRSNKERGRILKRRSLA
jgi:hypothetical protein